MTAYGSEALFDDARRRGAFASFDKPFEMNALAPIVARALEALPTAARYTRRDADPDHSRRRRRAADSLVA